MKKIHLAIATNSIDKTIEDYSVRLGCHPCVVIPNAYALWRTESINLSVRHNPSCKPGELRHLGFEDPSAEKFTATKDVNGITWEHFNAQQQAEEISEIWPEAEYVPAEI